MSLRTSATRYAKALFDVAVKESDAAQVERDLASIAAAMRQPDVQRVMTSAAVPDHVRVNIVRAIADKAAAAKPVAKLVVMLAERGRIELLPHVLDVYRERLLAHANIVKASVTTATPVPAEKTEALARSLGALTGKQVRLETSVDPALIGGVVARIGSTVYDGSIRTQLQKMKQQLVEKA
jgi:F-type H+-transporting ATPase subunit delta